MHAGEQVFLRDRNSRDDTFSPYDQSYKVRAVIHAGVLIIVVDVLATETYSTTRGSL